MKVGRVAEAIQELPQTLQATPAPVREMVRTVLSELREDGPEEVEVEFGVGLAAKAGVVITSVEGVVHLKVRLKWNKTDPAATGEEPKGDLG
ncbi:CU044_2847 family protein [Streptomyces sp. NPDC014733]|uniref:CU044_2847 family protein n=1 Tax=Streptomyces sp. NPDC014733 TaxID=3364885 RepID=UPI0037034379